MRLGAHDVLAAHDGQGDAVGHRGALAPGAGQSTIVGLYRQRSITLRAFEVFVEIVWVSP